MPRNVKSQALVMIMCQLAKIGTATMASTEDQKMA